MNKNNFVVFTDINTKEKIELHNNEIKKIYYDGNTIEIINHDDIIFQTNKIENKMLVINKDYPDTVYLQNSDFITETRDWNFDDDVYSLYGAYFSSFSYGEKGINEFLTSDNIYSNYFKIV